MRKDRLLKLADFLETVPRRNFDMSGWVTEKPTKPEGKRQGECGFAGCAMGWAAHAKLFPGLSLEPFCNDLIATYRGSEGFDAADELFGLNPAPGWWGSSEESDYLFSPDSYNGKPTPKQVAKRIRKFVESGGKVPA